MLNENEIDIDLLKEQLLQRKNELAALIEEHQDDSKPVALDQQSVGRLSRMDAMQVQSMAQETKRRRERELGRIEQALVRMDEGDYGYCLQCGEVIGEKRLGFDPSVATCIGCAKGKL